MLQLARQLARRGNAHTATCSERVAALLMDDLDIPLPWHPEQPHLAEWQAWSAREIIFNLESSVEAKNIAQTHAKKRSSQLVQDDAIDDGPAADTRRFVVEDLGGAPVDLDDDAPPADPGKEKHEL